MGQNFPPISGSAGGGSREVLVAPRTYFVDPAGNDSNDGLTGGSPFLTVNKAFEVINTIDNQEFDVTVSLAAGTYSLTTALVVPSLVGTGNLILLGDSGSPNTRTIDSGGAIAEPLITANQSKRILIDGLTVENSTVGGSCIACVDGGLVNVKDLIFGTTDLAHFSIASNGILTVEGNYEITGGATWHIIVKNAVMVALAGSSNTITLTGTPAFVNQFVRCDVGFIEQSTTNFTYSGAATGQRYLVQLNGVINTFGAGATFFPGNSAGSAVTGGVYG